MSRQQQEVDVGSPVYTNNPWVFPIAHMFGNHMYATTAMFEPRFPTQVTLLSNSVLQDPLRRRMKFDITGSDHMVILMEEGTSQAYQLLCRDIRAGLKIWDSSLGSKTRIDSH